MGIFDKKPFEEDEEMMEEIETPAIDEAKKEALYASLKEKYGLNKFSDEERQKLVEENNAAASPIASAFAGFGAGLRGGNVSDAFDSAMKSSQAKTTAKLNAFDKGRENMARDFAFERDLTKADREDKSFAEDNDVTSPKSVAMIDYLKSVGYKGPDLPYSKAKDLSPVLTQAFEMKQKQADKNREYSLREQELGLKKSALSAEKNRFGQLPVDKQEVIKGLAKDNAGKESIANAIDAVLSNWDNLSDEEQLQQGRQLIKTLNSTQGKDAVGAEEAARLAGKLDFALGNLSPFNNNPIQFGRDLEGFKTDAQITSKGIRDAMAANQKTIDSNYGRQSQSPKTQSAGKIRVSNGSETLEIDPSDLADAEKDGFKRV